MTHRLPRGSEVFHAATPLASLLVPTLLATATPPRKCAELEGLIAAVNAVSIGFSAETEDLEATPVALTWRGGGPDPGCSPASAGRLPQE